MYIYIAILLACTQAAFSNIDSCFYENFMDGKDSALSDSCSELIENPWKFETYDSANIDQPPFSTASGFIRAGDLDKQCITSNFPISIKEGSELFIAYHATGETALSIELIDFYTSKSVDFLVMDLIYDQWSMDSYTLTKEGDFIIKVIAFTPEKSSIIIDSITYVDNRNELDSCIFPSDNDYDLSAEESFMDFAEKSDIKTIDTKESAENSERKNDKIVEVSDNVNGDVAESEGVVNNATKEEIINEKIKNDKIEDIKENVESELLNQDNENRSEDSNSKERMNKIEQSNYEVQDENVPDNDNNDVINGKQVDIGSITKTTDNNPVNKLGINSTENDNKIVDEIIDKQINSHQSVENIDSTEVLEEKDSALHAIDDYQDILHDNNEGISNEEKNHRSESNISEDESNIIEDETVEFVEIPENTNNSNTNGIDIPIDASERRNDTPKDDINNDVDNDDESKIDEDETIKFVEIPEDDNSREHENGENSNQNILDTRIHETNESEQKNDTPKDDSINDVDNNADDYTDVLNEKDDDTDSPKEALEDLRPISNDDIINIEIETTNFFKEKTSIETKLKDFDDTNLLESSQPFSERMSVGAEWFTFLTVVGVILSIACLLVFSAILLVTKRRSKKINDYPYYHYEMPQAKQTSKNDTFPFYSVP